MLPRLSLLAAIAALVASTLFLAGYRPLGFVQLSVAVAMVMAPLFLLTLTSRLGLLVWALGIEAALPVYQAAIYSSSLSNYKAVQAAPVLLTAGLLLTMSAIRGIRIVDRPVTIWLLASAPAFAVAGFVLPIGDWLVLGALAVLHPVGFYAIARSLPDSGVPMAAVSRLLGLFVTVAALSYLVLIPLELSARETHSLASVQFGARAYSMGAVLFLLWGAIVPGSVKWSAKARVGFHVVVLLLVATSFSRGVAASYLTLIALHYFVISRSKRSFTIDLAFGGLTLGAALVLAFPDIVRSSARFWQLRLNLVSNVQTVEVSLAAILRTDRSAIWSYAWELFSQRPIFGFGLGSTPELLYEISSGAFQFGGMHNVTLTTLVERGLVGWFGFLVVVYFIVRRAYTGRRWSIILGVGVFALFAHTTGAELILNSTRFLNSTITVSLLLLLGIASAFPSHATGRIGASPRPSEGRRRHKRSVT